MSRLSFILSLSLLLMLGFVAQANADTIVTPLEYTRTETIRESPASFTLHMPFMLSNEHPTAAQRMNSVIYAQLVRIWPEATISATKTVLNRAELIGQTTIDHFRIIRNDDKVLSLIIHGNFCGANCTDINFRYSFDARTGRPMELGQLVDSQGQAIILHSIQTHDIQRVHDALALLAPSDDSFADKRRSYRKCLTEVQQNDGLPDLLIGQNGLSFERNTLCDFPHVIAAWNLMGRDVFSFTQLASHFTPYGRSVLLGDGPRVAQPAPKLPWQSGLFLGTIGDLPIMLILDKHVIGDQEITASYAYRRYGLMIDLSGQMTGTHVHLVEEHGIIDARLEDCSLIGTWHNELRTLPFRAELQY